MGNRAKAPAVLTSSRTRVDYPVLVKLVADDIAVLVSLSANALREDMHAADQIEAFSRLHREGLDLDTIATTSA